MDTSSAQQPDQAINGVMTHRQAYVGALTYAIISKKENVKEAVKMAVDIGSRLSEAEKDACKSLVSSLMDESKRKDLFYISSEGKVLHSVDVKNKGFKTYGERADHIRGYIREFNQDQNEGGNVYASTDVEIFDFALASAQKNVDEIQIRCDALTN